VRAWKDAFGWPGIAPRWTRGNKEGVGTAYSTSSKVWFTLWGGTLTEVYYPTVDQPQLRDLQYLVTDGRSFFHEEKRHLRSKTKRLHHALGYHVINSDPNGRYAIHKDIIADPHLSCVLQHTTLEGDKEFLSNLRLYALCAPHLGGGGMNNNAYVIDIAGRKILAAEKGGYWLALGATVPFTRLSCGYVGYSDGWTDLAHDMQMDWEFDRALNGNVALTGQLDLSKSHEFTLGLALGDSLHSAVVQLVQSLGTPYSESRSRFVEQWERVHRRVLPLERQSGDRGHLYRSSYSLILAHEDKTYPGAFIASLSIPWGEVAGDEDKGGYHLVWTRDLVSMASALLAAGDMVSPLQALIYLAVSQHDDGGFSQNFWIDGEGYWRGIQLDEVAFPIILAWRLDREKVLKDFDPYPMVLRGARYLIQHGPATQQERWEEASGYSPSTLAFNIAALICAARFAHEQHDEKTAQYLEEYADFLECHIEDWTVTTQGTLVPGIKRHYIRIRPADIGDPAPDEDPNTGMLTLANVEPGHQATFPAKEIVDAGFLELVRYGIRRADDPIVMDSVRVIDAILKMDTPFGPCWRRYNHDGYGQREDGEPYQGWGTGRAWPLLTGERGHYELATGRDPKLYIRAMERFASSGGLLPEQVWDQPDRKDAHMHFGGPTGSAMPLMWAHGEYIKLLRSARDGKVCDLIPEVAKRYIEDRSECKKLEIWKPNRRVSSMGGGYTLRIQAPGAFRLHWSCDDWKTVEDTQSTQTSLGVEFVDIDGPTTQKTPIRFTLFWTESNRWEGRDYVVALKGPQNRFPEPASASTETGVSPVGQRRSGRLGRSQTRR
jgi:glucoamylase